MKRKPGHNIRALAAQRKLKAVLAFVTAGLIVIPPIVIMKYLESFSQNLLKLPSPPRPGQVPVPAFQIPFFYYVIIFCLGLIPIAQGISWWKLSQRADQGAEGEESIGQELKPLEEAGWQIEYGLWLDNNQGDVDVVCLSPKGQAFSIDVKSHRGEVVIQGKKLLRRMGKSTYPFEKDFLERAMQQALQVKKQKDWKFVSPIVAFSEATVKVPPGRHQGVYVVEKSRLVNLLRSMG